MAQVFLHENIDKQRRASSILPPEVHVALNTNRAIANTVENIGRHNDNRPNNSVALTSWIPFAITNGHLVLPVTTTLGSGSNQIFLTTATEVDHTGSPYTAVKNTMYSINVTGGAATLTLPASPSAGDRVGVKDSRGNAATNNITVGRNSSNIDGAASDHVISADGAYVEFEYINSTIGWIVK